MIYFYNSVTDVYFNMALDETLLKSTIEDDIFIIWQNYNAIIVGRNQNTLEEINQQAVESDKVNVIRRASGGGTVFQDNGNVCFAIILNKNRITDQSFKIILQPIINVLKKLGLNASFSGKNDIEIEGKKISGNAQLSYKDKILTHGTFLFDVDLTKIVKYLNIDQQKIMSKGIKSNKARVTNIKPLLKEKLSVKEFMNYILKEFSHNGKVSSIPQDIMLEAENLANSKYRTWEWNYGKSPEYQLHNRLRFEGKGTIDININVNKGIITNIKFYGDFLGSQGTEQLEQALIGCQYNKQNIKNIIASYDYKNIFGTGFELNEIMSVFNV